MKCSPYLLRLAIATAIGLAFVVSRSAPSPTAAASSSVSGQAYAASASGGGPVNAVSLPPGGETGGSLRGAGPVQVTGASSSSCTGGPAADSASASCATTINGFSVSVGGVPILSASQVRSQSNSTASSGGASSDSAGSAVTGLCVSTAPLLPCTPIDAGPGTIPLSIPGGPSGSLTVLQQIPRSIQDGVSGSGLTTRGLHLELTIPGAGGYSGDFAVADSFVSGLQSQIAEARQADPPLALPALPALPIPPGPGAPEPPVPLPALPVPPAPSLPAPIPGLPLPGLPAPGLPAPALPPPLNALLPALPGAAPAPAPPAEAPATEPAAGIGGPSSEKAGPSALPNAGNGGPFSPTTPVIAGALGLMALLGAAVRVLARRL